MFIIIPETVDQDRNLSSDAKRCFGYIMSLNRGNYGCLASNQWFADTLGVSYRSAQRYIKELEERGYIKIERYERKRKRNVRMLIPTKQFLLTPKETKEKMINRYHKEKNLLPNDIESDWLDDYIDSL